MTSSTSSPSTPGEPWRCANDETWDLRSCTPDEAHPICATWNRDNTPPGGGTRQRPGGWVPELGCWIAWLRDLDPMDLIWLGPVDPLTPAVDHQVPETYDDHVRVVRWADGTSPAPPAPLTRPDTAALRADAMNASAWVPLTGKALAVRLFAAADWIDAQPAPLTPTPCPYVVTGDEGTSYCALAEHGPTPAPQRDRDALYDDLLTAARKGCFCEPHSKPCPDHMMYADGLEAGLRAATSPGTGDNP